MPSIVLTNAERDLLAVLCELALTAHDAPAEETRRLFYDFSAADWSNVRYLAEVLPVPEGPEQTTMRLNW
jgi:hypothetical protein